jgi:hypothetical protein
VPSHDTSSRIRILDPQAFEAIFRRFTSLFCTVLAKDTVVAFDGKAIRNAIAEGCRCSPLHRVNVRACDASITLAQFKAPNRNEVAGALEVLELLSIAGTFAAADALHCGPDIARAILDKDADYVLALKANHPKLPAAVKRCIELAPAPSRDEQPAVRSHGRFERRFPGLRAVACIETWRGATKLPSNPRLKFFTPIPQRCLSITKSSAPDGAMTSSRRSSTTHQNQGPVDLFHMRMPCGGKGDQAAAQHQARDG